jgi:hypothetical protein
VDQREALEMHSAAQNLLPLTLILQTVAVLATAAELE